MEEPTIEEQDDSLDQPTPFLLDLDTIESPQLPVTLNGKVYYMLGKHDMSMADREELRLVMVQLAEMQEALVERRDQSMSDNERRVFDDLERRLCALSFGGKVPKKVIDGMSPAQRNILIDRFFTEVDVTELIRSFAATMKLLNRQNQDRNQRLQPLQKPNGSVPPPPIDLMSSKPSTTTSKKSGSTSSSPPD